MATITTTKSTAGWVPTNVVFGVGSTAQTDTNNLNTDVNSKHVANGFELKVFHVTAVNNDETVTIEAPVVAAAWQAEDADDDRASCYALVAASATNNRARTSTSIRFSTAGTNIAGWIWCLCRS